MSPPAAGNPHPSGPVGWTMKGVPLRVLVFAVMALGLPLAGVALAGKPVARYLEFPPTAVYVAHASFSWAAFAAGALLLAASLYPFLRRALRAGGDGRKTPPAGPLPWWGWAGLGLGAASWAFAWSRFPGLAPIREHAFTLLWAAYILVVNALAVRRTGRCLMLDRPRYFALLFLASGAFWWFFEYLNRFVQNWTYVGVRGYTPWGYFWAATIPFSTVLPAVLSTRGLLSTVPRIDRAFARFHPIGLRRPKAAAGATLLIAAAGLAGIGVWPDLLYPLLWLAPLVVLVALDVLAGEPHVLSSLSEGDWRPAVTAALAALICGVFWEMWNAYSLAKWVYAVPYVYRFRLFEMPLLGYGGYLPFGLECAAAADLLDRALRADGRE